MPPEDHQNRIEELKKSLYSRTAPDIRTRRKLRFSDDESEVMTSWQEPEEKKIEPVLTMKYGKNTMSFFTKLLIASVLFCIVAVGIGAYLFFNGSNLISANNITININGPVSIPGGEPVSFDVTVKNNNNIDLKSVDMAVEFPAGATDPLNPSRELKTTRQLLGDMSASGSIKKTISAVIFGEENLQKQINVTVTYSVKGSTALFKKSQSYEILINSSPITVTASSFNQITSGQEFSMKVDLRSNSQQTLKNVLLKANYPFGYTFSSSNIKPLADNSTWRIGDIPAGGNRTVTIIGKLDGQDTDTKTFHFTVGAQSLSDSKLIGTQFMAIQRDISIQKPFISLGIAIDGDDDSTDHVGQFNKPENVQITWFNNLPTAVSNMTITAKLSGSAYDKVSVQPNLGYYRSITDDVVWNQQTNPEFANVAAGQTGTLTFAVVPKDKGSGGSPVVNPTVHFNISVSANRTQETNVSGSLTSAVSRTTRISSNIALAGRVVRAQGPFINTGAIPPKIEKPTTYTIIWTVDNTSSTVGNAQVTATIPPYVKWLGIVSPASESVTYEPNSGTITWNIGNISTYTIDSSRRREAAFQISFLPSVSQLDQSPTLINEASLTAIDSFTNASLSSSQDYLTTRFSTDASYKRGDELVGK